MSGAPRIEFLLIRSDPPCSRCRKTKALLDELCAARPEEISVRQITTKDAEAGQYGAVLTPMLLLNGKVVCAGMAPVRAGLQKLIEGELAARRGQAPFPAA